MMAGAAQSPAPLLPVAKALGFLLEAAEKRPPRSERVPIGKAAGRVLAADLAARRSQPRVALSAMDGFAVRAADASPGAALRLIGESAAGHPFRGRLQAGEAIRLYTGAHLPDGADAVLIEENGEVEGEILRPRANVAPGRFVRPAGMDFSEGQILLRRGQRLDAAKLALAAAMNHARVLVAKQPRIAVLATGDELALPGAPEDSEQTIASNPFAVMAMIAAQGGMPLDLGIAADTPESLRSAFSAAAAAKADCLVTIGGASIGRHDLVRPVAQSVGAHLDFYKIAMRPGKPLNFGAIGPMLLLGLPGNPVSAYVCAHLFLVPLLAALQGDRAAGSDRSEPAVLGADLAGNDEREDYLRATLKRNEAGTLIASALENQDSSLLSVLARAEALLIRAPHAPAAKAGEPCRILRL